MGSILTKLGVAPASLSQAGAVSLHTLSQVALLLEVKDASNTRYVQTQCWIVDGSWTLGDNTGNITSYLQCVNNNKKVSIPQILNFYKVF